MARKAKTEKIVCENCEKSVCCNCAIFLEEGVALCPNCFIALTEKAIVEEKEEK